MSEYRRFFSYIYTYEQNQKTSNTGFAKIEMRGPMTTIELHMRGVALPAPTASLYLFVRNDDAILGFPLGDVPFSGGNANRRFTLNQSELGESSYHISDVAGILLTVNDQICFVSQWDEAPISWEHFTVYKPEDSSTPEPEEASEAASEEEPEPQPEPEQKQEHASTEKNVIQSAELPQSQQRFPIFSAAPTTIPLHKIPKSNPLNNETATEQISHIRQPVPKNSWQETWQKLTASLPLIQPFANQNIHCVRAELKDLRLLPPSNWHLCNNSFLLHAFFTYRHLIFGEIPSAKDHKWFIGVPGIRYRQEHVLAAIFGFSDFLPDKESTNAEAPFGYWYIAMTEAD